MKNLFITNQWLGVSVRGLGGQDQEVRVSNMKYIENAFQIHQCVCVLEVKLGLIYYELISNIFKEIGPRLILRCFGRSDGLPINPVKTIRHFSETIRHVWSNYLSMKTFQEVDTTLPTVMSWQAQSCIGHRPQHHAPIRPG